MLVFLWPIGIFFGNLVKFLVIWFIFSRFGRDVLPNYVNGFKVNHLATLIDPT
jgi:hypothetical protein